MQQGSFNINNYFPGGSADIGRIERDVQSGIFSDSQLNQIMDGLEREIRGLRDDLRKSNKLNIILGAITIISIIITIISILSLFC